MSKKIYMPFPCTSYEALIRTIRDLPTELRPVYFSFSERIQSKEDRLDNTQRFSKYSEKSKHVGATLIGKKIAFHTWPSVFRDKEGRQTHGFLFVEVKRGFNHVEKLQDMLHLLVEVCGVQFGYVCEYAESQYRNYLKKKWANPSDHAGTSSVEFTIGVDFREYVTGLYWYTVFEQEYLTERGVSSDDIAQISIENDSYLTRDGRIFHCYKFFEKPDKWKEHADKLDHFSCEREQFFSLLRICDQIEAAQSDAALDVVLSEYR